MRDKAMFGKLAMMAMASEFMKGEERTEIVAKPNYTDSLTDQEKAKRKGLKPFKYGYDVVYALNQKSADKKARKLGYI